MVLAFVLAAAVWTTPAWASFLPNGDFERHGGSLAGWSGDGATVALRAGGRGGGHAGRVSRRPHNPSFAARATLNPATSVAGGTYRAHGFVRSGSPGRTVCLKVLEITPAGSTIASRSACRRATRRWRAFPELDFRAERTGDRIALRAVQKAPSRAGDSFKIDDVSLTAPPGDGHAPAAPGGLTAVATSNTTVSLDWNAVSDGDGVAGYTIYRRGVPIAVVGGSRTAYTATTRAGTTASYRVDAVDASSSRSVRSRGVSVTTPASGGVLIAAAGDIACDPADGGFNGGNGTATACAQKATSDLILADSSISAVLALGDLQYGCGGYQAFQQSFDISWGRFFDKIHPAVGNHEYQSTGGTDCAPHAAGYFGYFGAAAGNAQADSAWNAGAWHMIALNGECGAVGGCDASSPQGQFLRTHLGSRQCTLAYWHEPYATGASHDGDYRYFWQTLSAAGADVVLNGHIHTYARFAPQDPDGQVNAADGIREFIVGTGGKSQGALPGSQNVEFTRSGFGVLELRLHDTSYDWKFVGVDGSVIDSGSAPCH
ncbi:MAG TPA: metallophosphoesterase [Gaiellales bacterium]|nr:metallophosphoesterase [Gaiellales bacterium]